MAHTTDRMRPLRRSSCHGDDAGTRVGSKRSGGAPTSASRRMGGGPLVERVEEAVHLEVGQRKHVPQAAREERAAVAHHRQPADDLDAHGVERVEIERRALGRAHELRRRQPSRARQVVDLVVALVPHARAIHPPQHVAPAVGARQPHVLAHRDGDGPPGLLQFGRQLQAGGRRSHDQHAAVGQIAGPAVVERRELLDRRRNGRSYRGHAGQVAGAAGDDHAPGAELAGARGEPVALVVARDGRDRGVGADGGLRQPRRSA